MLHPCQVAAPFQVLNARNEIAFFFAPFDGTLKRVDLAVKPANVNTNGDAAFDVKLNGASIFGSPADRPKILSGATKGYVSALAVAVTEGDVISFDAATIPAGGFQGPVMLQCLIDDNITAGLDTAAVNALIAAFGPGGDVAGTLAAAIVGQIRSRSLAGIPLPPAAVADDFNDNSIDGSLWTQLDGAHAALEQNHRLELQPCVGTFSGLALVVEDFTNHSSQVAVIQTQSDAMTMLWNVPGGYSVHFMARSTNGMLWPFIYGPSGFVTSGPQTVAVSSGMLIRIRHATAGDTIYFDYSTDGGATWTTLHSLAGFGHSLAGTTLHLRHYDTSGVSIFDSFSTDLGTDALATMDGWPIVWDAAHTEFTVAQVVTALMKGIEGVLGAPAGHATALCEFHYDRVARRLKIYNDDLVQWDFIDASGHD